MGEYFLMGDYDAEIYRSMNDIYGEVQSMRNSNVSLNETMKVLVEEIRGLRQDLKERANAP